MYNDNTFNGLFTGTSDGNGGWNYPTAAQNFAITFTDFYIGPENLVSGGATISSEIGEADDFTIGNAPAKVFSATFNDPDDLMDSLTWGYGSVYIGCVTASAAADTYSSLPCHVYVNSIHYGINSSGNARRGSSTYTLGGTPKAVISNATGTDVLFITDTKIGRYNGSFSVVTSPSPAQAFMAEKGRQYADPMGIALDSNGCPAVFNDVTNATKQTFSYVPMGTFDFSNIDSSGIAFGVEAYDKMVLFDADATDWVANLNFSTPKTIDDLVTELMTEMGMTANISASAVNRLTVSWSANPITSYAVTYRDILKWLAEIMGCNARIGRTGNVEFYTIDPTAVETIEPSVIVGSTRTKTRYSIPVIDKVVCYNTLGAGYEYHTGNGDVPYYIVGNPFLDPSADIQPLIDLLGVLDDVPAYYPTTLNQVCADPRIDSGDVVNARPVGGATDGTDDYPVLVSRQTLTWNNSCLAVITATGNQVRAIPEEMNNTDLSSMVDSNPVSVINKIEAVGISADWITSGKLTVTDSSNRTLFDADKDTRQVKIAGFTVDYRGISRTYGTVSSELNSIGYLDFNDTDVDDPSHTRVEPEGMLVEDTSLGEATTVLAGRVRVADSSDYVELAPGFAAVKGSSNNETDVEPTGITFKDGVASPTLRVYRRTLDSSGSVTMTLDNGTYIAIVTHRNSSVTSETGVYIIQCYSTSSILALSAAANQSLSISGHTLTWTTTNTYRQLRLIYLS